MGLKEIAYIMDKVHRIIKFYKNEKERFMIICSLNCIIVLFYGRNLMGTSYNHSWTFYVADFVYD
jgi:hypothetical protein